MKRPQKKTHKSAESKKRSEASKKGWVTRRRNLKSTPKKSSKVSKSRTLSSEKLKKLQREEKIRIISRRKSQKKGRSLTTDKSKYKSKPVRPTHRPSKRRASIR